MKKFIIKTLFFVVPFFTLHLINVFFYSDEEGDLIRVGYLYSNPSPQSEVVSFHFDKKLFDHLSEFYDRVSETRFQVVSIGDSFSEQDNLGYQNFLSAKGVNLLHIDRFLSGENPIQTLIGLLNGDFFEHVNTEHVILQCVERTFNKRTALIDWNHCISMEEVSSSIADHQKSIPRKGLDFFSHTTLKIPITNFEYLFTSKPSYSQTYKYKSNNIGLFTNAPDNLLFFEDEISKLSISNVASKTLHSINVLNQLNSLAIKKNIKLIVLISPDKYDLYYPYIENKAKLQAPEFFSTYNIHEKDYRDIDAFNILSKEIMSTKDVYYYDDTHWSPKAANLIAESIYSTLY